MIQIDNSPSFLNIPEDVEFDLQKWSACSCNDADEFARIMDRFGIVGRQIVGVELLGLDHLHTREMIEAGVDLAYDQIAKETSFDREAVIDEPLKIELDDGRTFEILVEQYDEYRVSMDALPFWVVPGVGSPNIVGNDLFAPCLGKVIRNIEIEKRKNSQDEGCRDLPNEGRSGISRLILRFDDGTGLDIHGCWLEYCSVSCTDADGRLQMLSFEKLMAALYNWEDLHCDALTGFCANSPTVYFGERGREVAMEPYLTIGSGKHRMYISSLNKDFLLLEWAVMNVRKDGFFDEFSSYAFTSAQWKNVLAEAEKLLSFARFDELFEYMRSLDIKKSDGQNIPVICLNSRGSYFWTHKAKFRTQLEDVKKWTRIALSGQDKVSVWGY